MNDKVKALFSAAYKCCPELKEARWRYINCPAIREDYWHYYPIHLEHILRTAAARGVRGFLIDQDGWVVIQVRSLSDIKYLRRCKLDLSKSVEEQEEAVLIKLSEIIL